MPKNKYVNPALLILIVISLLLTACGQTRGKFPAVIDSPTSFQTSSQNATDLPTLPAGSYRTILKAKDFHPEFIEALPTLPNYFGQWELKIDEQNHFSLNLKNQVMVEGDYEYRFDQIYFNTSTNWPSLCPGNSVDESQTAVYQWHFENKILDLTGKDTTCSVRGLVFSNLLALSDQ